MKWTGPLAKEFEALAQRAGQREKMLSRLGYHMTTHWPKFLFGWAPWQRPLLRSGSPLNDTHRLRDSFAWTNTKDQLTVGTNVPYANLHNKPAGSWTIVTAKKGKYLTIPNPKALGVNGARSLQAGDFPWRFFRRRSGPGGFGLYPAHDKNARQPYFWLRPLVRIPGRQFLFWSDVAVNPIVREFAEWVMFKKWPSLTRDRPNTGGTPDVKARRGGRP